MSWAQLAKIDFLGTSPFQNLCCREVRKFLTGLEFIEQGEAEKVFIASIPSTDLTLYLYYDTVILQSTTARLTLKPEDFERPEDIVARLIAELSNAI